MNPLLAAKRRAAEQLSAFLERYPDEPDLEARLVDLVEGTIHKGTEGFHRQDPRAVEDPGLDATWIPTVPAELFDRLEAAGLVLQDATENQWVWSSDWLAAILGLTALMRGSSRDAQEGLNAWLSGATTKVATGALCLLAGARIDEDNSAGLQPFLRSEIGIAALAGAVALHAPADDDDGSSAPGETDVATELAKFTALLDRLFGLPQALQPAPDKFRVAKVINRAEMRLEGLDGVAGARKLLRQRLVLLLGSAADAAPRYPLYLRSLGRALVASAESEEVAIQALDDCARALAVRQRVAALTLLAPPTSEDPWLRSFLHRVCSRLINLPQQGDPASFSAVYAEAFEALAELPADPPSRERVLRHQVTLLGRTIQLKWEAKPGDTLAAFDRALDLIEELLVLAPAHWEYRAGKKEFLEELAQFLESTDPARAESIRNEAAQLARELPPATPPAPAVGLPGQESSAPVTPPVPPVRSAPGTAAPAPPVASGASRDELLAGIRAAWSVARTDPVGAINAARQVVEALCRSVLLIEMGRPPGKPSYDAVVTWLRESKTLPERLNYQIIVLEWHAGVSLEELSRSRMFGSSPGVTCCAAMTRLARWYFAEYLRVDLPEEIDNDAPNAAQFRLVAPPDVPPDDLPLIQSNVLSNVSSTAPGLRLVSVGGGPAATAPPRRAARGTSRRAVPTFAARTSASSHPRREASRFHPAQEAAARELGVSPTVEDALTGMVLVLIPGGEVWVEEGPGEGAAADGERPRHRVQVRPFYCATSPVLQEEWSRFMENDPSHHPGARRPVANLAWDEVQAFLARANVGRTGPNLRLLREPEWYRAARAGAETEFWWGADYRAGYANCSDDGIGSGRQETSEPRQYPANPFGLLDAYGNVWEWCEGVGPPAIKGARAFGAAREPVAEGSAALCGGSWKSFPYELSRTRHAKVSAGPRFDDFGFRCGRDVE